MHCKQWKVCVCNNYSTIEMKKKKRALMKKRNPLYFYRHTHVHCQRGSEEKKREALYVGGTGEFISRDRVQK